MAMYQSKEDKILKELGEEPGLQQITIDSFGGTAEEAAEALDEGSYSQSEAIELAKRDANFLAGLAMPLVFKVLFPPVIMAIWALLKRQAEQARSFPQIALGIPRGHAKTTIIKLFILFCILFTTKKFILIVGRNNDRAENILSDVIAMLNEYNIVRLFGQWNSDIAINRTDLKKFNFRGRSIVLMCLGCGGSARGVNINNERPDVIIFEDIQDADDAKSEIVSNATFDWMIGTAMKTKSPMGCLTIFIGNMFPGNNSILKKLKNNKKWIKFISGAILADGTALWEGLRPLKDLIDEFENDMEAGKPDIFLAEVMNDTDLNINGNIDISKRKSWPFKSDEYPQGKMIIIDPASGKKNSDPCSIGYVEVYDGFCGLKQVVEGNFSPGQTIMRAFLMALETKTKLIVCESVAYQSTLLYWFEEKAKELGINGLYFMPIHSTFVSKNARIVEGIRAVLENEFFIHDDIWARVSKQMVEFKPMRRDNDDGILDIITFAPRALQEYEGLMLTPEEITIQNVDNRGTIEGAYAF